MAHTLGDVASSIGAGLEDGDPQREIRGLGTLEHARGSDLSFFSNRRYTHFLKTTRAAAVILKPADRGLCTVAKLVMDDPYLGYARAAQLLYPETPLSPGIHPLAVIEADASVHASAAIGAHVTIGAGAVIADQRCASPPSSRGIPTTRAAPSLPRLTCTRTMPSPSAKSAARSRSAWLTCRGSSRPSRSARALAAP